MMHGAYNVKLKNAVFYGAVIGKCIDDDSVDPQISYVHILFFYFSTDVKQQAYIVPPNIWGLSDHFNASYVAVTNSVIQSNMS